MSDRRWSPTVQALLAKAKADTPTGAARANMWAGISTAVGGAAGASGFPRPHVHDGGPPHAASLEGMEAGANAVAGGGSAMKMLTIGTLLGSTAAVGLTLAMLRVGAAPTSSTKLSAEPWTQLSTSVVADGRSLRLTTAPSADVPSATPERGRNNAAPVRVSPVLANREAMIPAFGATAGNVQLPEDDSAAPARGMVTSRDALSAADGTSPRLTMQASADMPWPAPERGQSSAVRPRSTPARSTPVIDDSLIREASFLSEARAALLRGDAKSALRKLRAARSLPVRQLVPEELSVEAQTLRALDRASEAVEAERTLRTKYPESALAK
jgi:hypothetical protein